MQDLARYLRASGASSDAPYFAAGGKNVPGQQNLLDIAYYWVTHATDCSDPRDPVGRNENDIMARYINACYDFFQWAGAAGLFAFHKVRSSEEVAIITNGGNAQRIAIAKADLAAIADAEGLDYKQLEIEVTEFTRNPRLHPTTPWSTLTSITKERAGKDETIRKVELNLLYHRIQKIFDLLRLWDWKKYTDKGVGTLVRQARAYAAQDTARHKSGFAWIRLDLINAGKENVRGSYGDSFSRLSYRYIVNYIGGHLTYFRKYADYGMRKKGAFWMEYCKKLHPLARWRLYLEIAYMITLLTQRTAPKEEARSMSKLIQEVLPVIAGDQAFTGLASALGKVIPPKEGLDKADAKVVEEFQVLIEKEEWVELVDRLYKRLVTEAAKNRGHVRTEEAAGVRQETAKQKYFRELQEAAMLFIQKRLGLVLLLRHFYRSLYFYFPPEVPDFLPPIFLDNALDKKTFAMLLDQEAIAARYLGRRPTGGKRRVRVVIPLEIAALLSKVVIDPEQGTPLADMLVDPIEGSRAELLDRLPALTDLPDRDYRIVLRFYMNDGTETCFAINEHVWHAAQHELNRRLCNHVYNCQVLAARIARTGRKPHRLDKAVDVIAKVATQQASQIVDGAKRRVAIARALLKFLPESFAALASFAFSGRLPKGFVTALKHQADEKSSLKDATAFEIDRITRHLRNLADVSEEEDEPGKYYTFDGTFPYVLGRTLNRRRLRPRLDYAHNLAAAPYQKQKNKRMLDILAWAKSKRLLLHLRQDGDAGDDEKNNEEDGAENGDSAGNEIGNKEKGEEGDIDENLALFTDVWGRTDPSALAKKLAKSAKKHIALFTKNYPNFKQYPAFPDGLALTTTADILNPQPVPSTLNPANPTSSKTNDTLTRDALLLAVMKALVLAAEQDARDNQEVFIYKVADNVRAKLLRMIYANEFLMKQTSGEKLAELKDNGLRPGGLRFLVEMPALIPSIALTKTLGWAVSDIVRNPFVIERSLGQPLPAKVNGKDTGVDKETGMPATLEQAETRRLDSFTSSRKNYADAVQEVLSILGAAQALGASGGEWKKFVALIDDRWAKRVEQVATGDDAPPKGENLFLDLLGPAKKAFEAFARVMGKRLDEVEVGNARSLKIGNDEKLNPLPLPLSSESPTIASIQPFATIEDHLRNKTVVPVLDVLHDCRLIEQGKQWQVEVNGEQETLTGGYRPGAIPFIIDVNPLAGEQIREYGTFFGDAKNPLQPEVGIERHRVGNRDTRDGKLANWKESYTTKERDLKGEIEAILATMNQLRKYKIGIERRLESRTNTVLDLVRLGYPVEKISQKLRTRDMGMGLTSAEEDAVQTFLKAGAPGTDDPAKVKELSTSILKDNPYDPGKRVDHYLGNTEDAKRRAENLKKLLGGLTVTTWNVGEFVRAAARGEKLAGIIGLHLARLGFRLRTLRVQREFYLTCKERIDRASKDEIRVEKKRTDLTAKSFDESLKWIRQQALFVGFRDSGILPCEISLTKGLPVAGEGPDGETTVYECKGRLLEKVIQRGTIDAIQIQAPLYPSGTVAANVFVKGPMLVTHASTSLAKWQEKRFGSELNKNLVTSLDINQLNCARTVAPGLVAIVPDRAGGKRGADPKEKIEDWDLPFEEWARLADVFDYTSGRNRPNQYGGKKKRSQGGGLKNVYPAALFYRKVFSAAYAPAGKVTTTTRRATSSKNPKLPVKTTRRPSASTPYDIDALKVKLDFRDKLGALMKYRGAKHAHLERKKGAITRKKKILAKSDRGHFLRARTALYFINQACNHVRDADLMYLFHAISYCQARSGAAYIAHEKLGLGTGGGEGGLGRIISSMMKDFKPAKTFLVRQFKALEREPKNSPKMDGVSPAYTSQTCNHCARTGVKGTLDDSASANYAICDKCGHIYDRHGVATGNIGDRFVRVKFGEKKNGTKRNKRKKGDAKEEKG